MNIRELSWLDDCISSKLSAEEIDKNNSEESIAALSKCTAPTRLIEAYKIIYGNSREDDAKPSSQGRRSKEFEASGTNDRAIRADIKQLAQKQARTV